MLNFVPKVVSIHTCSGVVKGGGGRGGATFHPPTPPCVQDHSKSLIPCRSGGTDPLECLRRLLLALPPKTMTLATPLHTCFTIYGLTMITFFMSGSLHPDDIISNHTVHSQNECLLMCLQKSTCVGFNYRAAKSNKYVINCQLSNKTNGKNHVQSGQTGEWKFYRDMRTTVSETRILIGLG